MSPLPLPSHLAHPYPAPAPMGPPMPPDTVLHLPIGSQTSPNGKPVPFVPPTLVPGDGRGPVIKPGAPDDLEVKYKRLKKKYFDMEEKWKEATNAAQRAGRQTIRLKREKAALLDRILELQAANPPHLSPNGVAHSVVTAFPRKLALSRKSIDTAVLAQAFDEVDDNDDHDNVFSSLPRPSNPDAWQGASSRRGITGVINDRPDEEHRAFKRPRTNSNGPPVNANVSLPTSVPRQSPHQAVFVVSEPSAYHGTHPPAGPSPPMDRPPALLPQAPPHAPAAATTPRMTVPSQSFPESSPVSPGSPSLPAFSNTTAASFHPHQEQADVASSTSSSSRQTPSRTVSAHSVPVAADPEPSSNQPRGTKSRRPRGSAASAASPGPNGASAKQFSVPVIPRDKSRKPLLPLSVGPMTLKSLGTISLKQGFHTPKYIYPVGYVVTRKYPSTIDPQGEAIYTCKIMDVADAPQFQIYPSDRPSNQSPYTSGTATGAWTAVLKAVNQIRPKPHITSIPGLDYFGLGQSAIRHLIQELDGADRLPNYVWQNYVEGGPLGGRHSQVTQAIIDDAPQHAAGAADESGIANSEMDIDVESTDHDAQPNPRGSISMQSIASNSTARHSPQEDDRRSTSVSGPGALPDKSGKSAPPHLNSGSSLSPIGGGMVNRENSILPPPQTRPRSRPPSPPIRNPSDINLLPYRSDSSFNGRAPSPSTDPYNSAGTQKPHYLNGNAHGPARLPTGRASSPMESKPDLVPTPLSASTATHNNSTPMAISVSPPPPAQAPTPSTASIPSGFAGILNAV